MSAAVELRGVERVFAGSPPVRAVAGVSLRIEHGEMVAMVGPSGSGKSTLLNLMGTLDRATAGSVVIAGTDTRELSDGELADLRAASIGFVFQEFHLLERLTARDNVAQGLLYRGVGRRARLAAADEALARVGLSDKRHVPTPKLSGGQRQRVAVARALVGQPAVLLADEPTGNLDSRTSAEIVELLVSENRDGGTTVVLITHDEEVARHAPRRIRILDGRVGDDERSL